MRTPEIDSILVKSLFPQRRHESFLLRAAVRPGALIAAPYQFDAG